MNSARSIEDYIAEIVECGTRATGYLKEMTFEDFERDDRTQYAVAKCIELCGEAAHNIGKIDATIPSRFPEFDIRSAYGMRNILAHAYYTMRLGVLWTTARESLPEFVEIAKRILASRSQTP